jgi:hypothetical protein
MSLADLICHFGYKPEDDSWDGDGRRTYIHDAAADLVFVRNLALALTAHGWRRDLHQLRAFHHESGEFIELEPGGPDTSGHYLHHMKAAVIA